MNSEETRPDDKQHDKQNKVEVISAMMRGLNLILFGVLSIAAPAAFIYLLWEIDTLEKQNSGSDKTEIEVMPNNPPITFPSTLSIEVKGLTTPAPVIVIPPAKESHGVDPPGVPKEEIQLLFRQLTDYMNCGRYTLKDLRYDTALLNKEIKRQKIDSKDYEWILEELRATDQAIDRLKRELTRSRTDAVRNDLKKQIAADSIARVGFQGELAICESQSVANDPKINTLKRIQSSLVKFREYFAAIEDLNSRSARTYKTMEAMVKINGNVDWSRFHAPLTNLINEYETHRLAYGMTADNLTSSINELQNFQNLKDSTFKFPSMITEERTFPCK